VNSIVCCEPVKAEMILPFLINVRKYVDGPFWCWKGRDRHERAWRLYQIRENWDEAYTAARLSAERGCDLLLVFGSAKTGAETAQSLTSQYPLPVVSPSYAIDYSPLLELQRLCPNSVESLPIPLPEPAHGKKYQLVSCFESELEILGSTRISLTVPKLGLVMRNNGGAACFDQTSVSFARGCREEGISFGTIRLVNDVLEHSGMRYSGTQKELAKIRDTLHLVCESLDLFGKASNVLAERAKS